MRVLTILGIFIFGGLAIFGYKTLKQDLDRDNDEIPVFPSICSRIVFIGCLIVSISCLIYSLGLWDIIGDWLGLNTPEVPAGRQF